MLHKVLIIDDNHSFIDSLTVILKDFSFQYDSAFRFQEATQKIEKNGSLMRRSVSKKLFNFEEEVKEFEAQVDLINKKKNNEEEVEINEELVAPEVPQIKEGLLNPMGYSLIIVEQDTETSLKGLNFIKNIIRINPEWDESDFIILTSKPDQIEAEAKQAGVSILEKPLKQNPFRQLVGKRIKSIEAEIERAQFLFDNLENQKAHLDSALSAAQKPKPAASAPEKKPSTRNKLLSKLTGDKKEKPAKKSTRTKAKAKTTTKKKAKKVTSSKSKAAKPEKKAKTAKKAKTVKKAAAKKKTAKKVTKKVAKKASAKKTKKVAKRAPAKKTAKKKTSKRKTAKRK